VLSKRLDAREDRGVQDAMKCDLPSFDWDVESIRFVCGVGYVLGTFGRDGLPIWSCLWWCCCPPLWMLDTLRWLQIVYRPGYSSETS